MPQVYLAILAPQAAPWTHALLAKKRVTNRFWKGALQTYTDPVNQAGQWALPGGKQEVNDQGSVHTAARREFREETGVDLQPYYPTRPGGGVLEEHAFSGDQTTTIRFWLAVLRVTDEQQTNIRTQVNTNVAPATKPVTRTTLVSMTTPSNAGIKKPTINKPKMAMPPQVRARLIREGKLAEVLPETQSKPKEEHKYTEQVPTGSPFSAQITDWELGSLEKVPRVDVGNRLGVPCQLVASEDDKLLVQSANWKTQDITWYAMVATHLTTKVA